MPNGSHNSCAGCTLDRRRFLHDAAIVGAALLAGPVAFIAPVATRGETRSYPVPAADGAQIDRDAEVILVRWQGAVYAFSLACPHQNTALRWFGEDQRFQCPKHKSKYRPDGSFIEGRATRGMDRFAVRRDAANIVVDLDALYREDKNAAEWASAVVKVA